MSVVEIVREIETLPIEERLKVLERLHGLTEEKSSSLSNGKDRPIWEIIEELGSRVPVEAWSKVPTDAAKNLDHYLYH